MTRRDRYIVTVVALLGVVGAYWLLALSPKRAESTKLDKDIASARQELDKSKQEKVQFAQAQLEFPRMYASLGRLGKAVPPDEDVPSLLVQLNHAAAQANVNFKSVELKLEGAAAAAAAPPPPPAAAPGEAAPAGEATPAGATGATGATGAADATGTTPPAAAPPEFKALPFEYKFEGSFSNLEALIHNITRLVDRRNQELAIAGRLVTIQGFSMKRGKVTLVATSYLLPADQGLFAGATPQGPGATDPAAPQAAAAGATTPAPPTAAVTAP
jgi:hypothetical protein